MEPLVRRIEPAIPVDLRLTLGIHRRGPGDPTFRFSRDGSVWRATRRPDGPATLRLIPDANAIRAQAWGPGAGWAIEQAAELVGANDEAVGFGRWWPAIRSSGTCTPGSPGSGSDGRAACWRRSSPRSSSRR
jgi:hypothetical protein